MSEAETKRWRQGGCHCGAVRFEANLPDHVVALSCNCSICAKSGFIHVIMEEEDFRLLQGEDNLTLYTFNTHQAKHWFCKTCGVKATYKPRSHPHGMSTNLRCYDEGAGFQVRFQEFDGANWEKNIAQINPELASEMDKDSD